MAEISEMPRRDLVRVAPRNVGEREFRIQARADADGGRVLFGHFAVFDTWTEIDSWYEGRFLERIAPGAFKKTIRENRDRMRCIYEHGFDAFMGNAPLGRIDELKEDDIGAYYEVPLIDTDYNRDRVVPQADAGLLGASFRFRVVKEDVVRPKEGSDELPKRTIIEVAVSEFGPCPFAAYPEATAGLRSRSELELWRSLDEQGRAEFARLMRQQAAAIGTPRGAAIEQPEEPASATPSVLISRSERLRRVIDLTEGLE